MECVLYLVMSSMERNPTFISEIARYFKIFWWIWGKNWSDYGSQGSWTIFILFFSALFETSLLCGGVLDMTHQNLGSRDSRLPRPSISMGGPSYLVPETKVLQPFRLNNLSHVTLVHRPPGTHNIQPCCCTLDFCFFFLGKSLILTDLKHFRV
jgi:hypothetical protein